MRRQILSLACPERIAAHAWKACIRRHYSRLACGGIWRPNAGAHLLPEAGAQRTLEAVRCSALIMIEASPSAYPSGMLALGKATN
jgi:hypothetical protein